MAEISGKMGDIDFTNAETYVKNWTLSLVGDALETTYFDVATSGRTFIAGLKGWSGSFECNYSSGNTVVPGGTGTIICRSSTGTGGVFTGSIIVTGMDVATPVDGIVTQGYTFQGTGAVALAT